MFRHFMPILALTAAAILASACTSAATTTSAPSTASTAAVVTQSPTTPAPVSTAETPTEAVTQAQANTVSDYATFVSTLKSQGWPIAEIGPSSGSVFTGDGHIVTINGAEVQVFEYADHAALEAQAALIAPDGSKVGGPKGTAIVDWVDMPHFFKSGRILAVYVGRDNATLLTLTHIMGDQFAGGTVEQWGPGSPTPIPPGDSNGLPPAPTGMTYPELAKALQDAGATIGGGEVIPQDWFSQGGQLLTVNGQKVEVWQYADDATAAADAATITDGGLTIGGKPVAFADTPHFYHDGRLIVLYVGQDESIMALLEKLLGKPMSAG